MDDPITPEEAAKLKETLAQLEVKAKKADELEAILKEKEDQFNKLSNKEYNFGRLREKTEAEINEMKEKMSVENRALLDEVVTLRTERDIERKKRFDEAKGSILEALSGGDEQLKTSIEAAEKDLTGEAITPKELEDRFRKAYILAKGERPKANPIFSGYSSSYREPNEKKKNWTETPDGQASYGSFFPNSPSQKKS